MVNSQQVRVAVTQYLAKYGIDATKVLEGVSAEGYEYLPDPTEVRRGQPVTEYVRDIAGRTVELRAWPSATVYENVVRILAGEKPVADVLPADENPAAHQAAEIATAAGVEPKQVPAVVEAAEKLNTKRTSGKAPE